MTPRQILPEQCVETRVKELREERGLSQEQLARLLGVTRQTIIAIEKGKYLPSLPLALLLARVFQVRVEDLFLLREECHPQTGVNGGQGREAGSL